MNMSVPLSRTQYTFLKRNEVELFLDNLFLLQYFIITLQSDFFTDHDPDLEILSWRKIYDT
jgi:hypothetical protein